MTIYPGLWERANRLEVERVACALAVSRAADGRELLFVIGGQTPDESSALNAVEVYDVDTWQRRWSGDLALNLRHA